LLETAKAAAASEVTAAARRVTPETGDSAPSLPTNELVDELYHDLRRIARWQRVRVSAGQTMNTTALINEAYVRLAGGSRFESRGHFLRAAAIAMHHVLVDRARAQMAQKRGAGASAGNVVVDELAEEVWVEDAQVALGVHEALDRLSVINSRLVHVVECRFYAGYTESETATALGRSVRTVQREWALARAWLKKELRPPSA
jgi:RNA polymerase sigma factor (TIGR02999 family)